MKKLSLNKKVIANITNADLNQIKGGETKTVIVQPTDAICSTNACVPKTSDCPTVPSCPLP